MVLDSVHTKSQNPKQNEKRKKSKILLKLLLQVFQKIILEKQKTFNISDKLDILKEDYERIKELLEVGEGTDILQSEKFITFKNFLEDRNEILQQNIEKQDKIDLLKDILKSKQILLEVISK